MSLRGYVKKTIPALWTLTAQRVPLAVTLHGVMNPTLPPVVWKRIPRVSKRNQVRTTEYIKAARAFVKAAIKRGETCVVVNTIAELKDARRYGCATSNKLTEVHHRFGRDAALLMWKRGWMAISRAGHRWVEANKDKAREYGWLAQRGEWNNQKVIARYERKKTS